MQSREHQFNDGRFFFGVHAKGNAAPIVFDAHRAIAVQLHRDFFAVPCQRFICGVVDHLLDDVQGVVGAGVHARALLDRLQAFQDADRAFGIFRLFACHGARL